MIVFLIFLRAVSSYCFLLLPSTIPDWDGLSLAPESASDWFFRLTGVAFTLEFIRPALLSLFSCLSTLSTFGAWLAKMESELWVLSTERKAWSFKDFFAPGFGAAGASFLRDEVAYWTCTGCFGTSTAAWPAAAAFLILFIASFAACTASILLTSSEFWISLLPAPNMLSSD